MQLETIKTGSEPSQFTDLSIVLAIGKPNTSIVHELFPVRYVPAYNKKLYRKLKNIGYSALKTSL